MYELAADFALIVHLAFITFVVFGALLFFVLTKIIYFHLPALFWGIYIELTDSVCPLTHLENWFLQKTDLKIYSEGFIQNYLVPIGYPKKLTEDLQIYFAIAIVVINSTIYGFIIYKTRKI